MSCVPDDFGVRPGVPLLHPAALAPLGTSMPMDSTPPPWPSHLASRTPAASSADAAAHALAARSTSPCRQPRVCVQTWCRSWFRSTATAADPASATTSIAAVAATVASLAVSACACATATVAMASAPNLWLASHAFIGLRRRPHQAVGVPATVPSARAAWARAALATRQRLLPAAQSSGHLDPELQ